MTPQDRKWIAIELKSDECKCGNDKRPRYSFCYPCYKSLPKEMQAALYRPFGFGYEEAYEEAVEYLT